MLGWGEGTILQFIGSIWLHKEPLDFGGIQVENHGSNIDLKLFLYGFGSFMSVFKLGVNFSV